MSTRWKQGLLALPSVGVSLLPKLACPACWPAYAGLLTSVGLGFLLSVVYLFPLTTAFLVLALGALAFRAKQRRGYGPFLLGIVAAGGVLLGKFVWESTLIMHGAVGLLVISSLWNTWPRGGTPNQEASRSDCNTEEVQRSI
ncbi:MAG: MerC family mercury resistance protein [Candidatus Acidiferrales bacterium]